MKDVSMRDRLQALETVHYADALRITLAGALWDECRPVEAMILREVRVPVKFRMGIICVSHFALWNPPPVNEYKIRELLRDVHTHTLAKLNMARKEVIGLAELNEYGASMVSAAQRVYRLEEAIVPPLTADTIDLWMRRSNAAVDALFIPMRFLPENIDLSTF